MKIAVRELRPGHIVIFNNGDRKEVTNARLLHEPKIYIYGSEGTKVAIEITFSDGERLVGYPPARVTIDPVASNSEAMSRILA